MPLRKGDPLRTAQAAAVIAILDAGAGPAEARIYTGSQPATPATAASGTLLATVVLGDPSYVAGAAGVLDLANPASVNGVADGTAGWVRVVPSDGTPGFDGHATTTGGGGVLELTSLSITNGGAVDVTGGTYTVPM